MTGLALSAVLPFVPGYAAEYPSSPPALTASADVPEHLGEEASFPSWKEPARPQRLPLLAARGSFSDSGRPARQMRVGGVGGGYHGPSDTGLPFEPEVPGQSLQQSIGQTLAQPPKPAPSKDLEKPRKKATGKQPQKSSASAKGHQPSKQAPKPRAHAQKKPAPQYTPTVYIITMNDGQVIKGTMKPAGGSYIVSTRNGPLTISKKHIVKLTKALP